MAIWCVFFFDTDLSHSKLSVYFAQIIAGPDAGNVLCCSRIWLYIQIIDAVVLIVEPTFYIHAHKNKLVNQLSTENCLFIKAYSFSHHAVISFFSEISFFNILMCNTHEKPKDSRMPT